MVQLEPKLIAGVLSGTSGDGIDVAIARFSGETELTLDECVAFETLPFETQLASRVRAVLDGEDLGLRGAALLSRDLGRAFGSAARALAFANGVQLDLVASHGQTVFHHDGEEPSGAATLQLGDGDFVAEEARTACVSDFRQRDIAAGGEGAPLSALADPILFRNAAKPLALLNLGGMANLTLLGANGEVAAFDTGPANAWLDGLARLFFDKPFDDSGKLAAQGSVDDAFLAVLLEHPFFDREPPKSTGRDTFGAVQLDAALARASGLVAVDVLRTAVEAVARSVAEAIDRWAPETPSVVHACGGGIHNATLAATLENTLGRKLATTRQLGIDPDAREALVFAALGAANLAGVPLSHPGATGARAGVILGKFSGARIDLASI